MQTYAEIADDLGITKASLQKKVWEFNTNLKRLAPGSGPILPDGSRDGGHFRTQLFNFKTAERIVKAVRLLSKRPKGRPKNPTPSEV